MQQELYSLPWTRLLIVLTLPAAVAVIYYRWRLPIQTVCYALLRMFLQLLLVGFCLVHIFANQSSLLVLLLLSFMLTAASWIALRPLKQRRPALFFSALAAIAAGGLTTLAVVVGLVVDLQPWYEARYLIPLAGMIFANAMNAVSLSAERLSAELSSSHSGEPENIAKAVQTAYQAALIPIVNSLFAVGIVSLPGMMTGQILSGISPLIAVRYQIMVMCMVFGASGISAAVYLKLAARLLSSDSRAAAFYARRQ